MWSSDGPRAFSPRCPGDWGSSGSFPSGGVGRSGPILGILEVPHSCSFCLGLYASRTAGIAGCELSTHGRGWVVAIAAPTAAADDSCRKGSKPGGRG